MATGTHPSNGKGQKNIVERETEPAIGVAFERLLGCGLYKTRLPQDVSPHWTLEPWALLPTGNYSTPTSMTDNIQVLGVVDRLFSEIVSGEKTSTIRWKERKIVVGLMKFVSDGLKSQTVLVDVVRCTDMPLSEAASFVGKLDEWPDQIMLEGMREHYPDIQLSSTVQVIEYKLPVPD